MIVAPLLLAACAGSSPRETAYDWNLEPDQQQVTHHHAHHAARNEHVAHYDDRYYAPITPTPKPDSDWTPAYGRKPGWYTQTSLPAPSQFGAADGRFLWPVRGRVIGDYGSTAGGERNDGIDIAAPLGTPIHAAASGTVSYAGDELRGYGNLILIRHEDGYVTAYAHAQSMTVSRGDPVLKGQVIGYTGDTGDVTQPQLHFEIRHGVTPVNPRAFMMASSR